MRVIIAELPGNIRPIAVKPGTTVGSWANSKHVHLDGKQLLLSNREVTNKKITSDQVMRNGDLVYIYSPTFC